MAQITDDFDDDALENSQRTPAKAKSGRRMIVLLILAVCLNILFMVLVLGLLRITTSTYEPNELTAVAPSETRTNALATPHEGADPQEISEAAEAFLEAVAAMPPPTHQVLPPEAYAHHTPSIGHMEYIPRVNVHKNNTILGDLVITWLTGEVTVHHHVPVSAASDMFEELQGDALAYYRVHINRVMKYPWTGTKPTTLIPSQNNYRYNAP